MTVNLVARFVSCLKLLDEYTTGIILRVKPTGVGKHNSIDKRPIKSYSVVMINAIKNKYYQYQPGEFLPIWMDGELSNRKQFHLYKLKRAALRADRAFQTVLDRAYAK